LLTQLVELDFRELLNSTLTKVVTGYITRELYITSFVKNNEFFLDKNIKFFDKNHIYNLLYNGNNDKTRYITTKLVI
jgi:hypothetical protein